MTDTKAILERLDDLAEVLAEVRTMIAQGADETPGPAVADAATAAESEDIDWTFRGLKFLKAFHDAPGRSLHKSAASQAAKDAGYDPRGTAGFYVGNGSLVKVGDYRVLTEIGAQWYSEYAVHYPELQDANG
jgi:hypothetical protein